MNISVSHAANLVVRALLLVAIVVTVFVAYGLVGNAWYTILAVRGGSMEPTISAGDLVVLTRPPAIVEEGMILTLQIDGAVVTHRVVEVQDDGRFITQGDANDARDDFSTNTVRIVGLYRVAIPLLGHVVDPLVSSGAWLTDLDTVSATAGSGSWVVSSSSITDDVQSLTWEAPMPAMPDATSQPNATATPTPEPTPDPLPTVDPKATPEATAGP